MELQTSAATSCGGAEPWLYRKVSAREREGSKWIGGAADSARATDLDQLWQHHSPFAWA